MSSKPLLPFVRKNTPLMDALRQRVSDKSALTHAEEALMMEFRRGMAEKLGVLPETINEDLLRKWILNWSRALAKPEHWAQEGYARRLGEDLIKMLPHGGSSSLVAPLSPSPPNAQEVREPPRGNTGEQERRDRYYRSEISIA